MNLQTDDSYVRLVDLRLVVTNTNDEAGGNFSEIDQRQGLSSCGLLLDIVGGLEFPLTFGCMLSNRPIASSDPDLTFV